MRQPTRLGAEWRVWHEGTVSYDEPFFTVVFDDGDAEDYKPADMKSLVEGIFNGARIKVHCGAEAGWVEGEVAERYRKLHGTIWEAEGQRSVRLVAELDEVAGLRPGALKLSTARQAQDDRPGRRLECGPCL